MLLPGCGPWPPLPGWKNFFFFFGRSAGFAAAAAWAAAKPGPAAGEAAAPEAAGPGAALPVALTCSCGGAGGGDAPATAPDRWPGVAPSLAGAGLVLSSCVHFLVHCFFEHSVARLSPPRTAVAESIGRHVSVWERGHGSGEVFFQSKGTGGRLLRSDARPQSIAIS